MDIESLSDKTAAQFIEELNISSIPELYALTHEQLVSLNRFGVKKAQNLLDALEKSKTVRSARSSLRLASRTSALKR
jgi:DNA ligase (NAD+)